MTAVYGGGSARKNANALPDDPSWCGHPAVSLRTWMCAECARPATAATRARLEAEPTAAPAGSLWVLLVTNDADEDVEPCEGQFYGMFTDRAVIARGLVRGRIIDAASLRERLRRTHWYQNVFGAGVFEGFGDEPDEHGRYQVYELSLERIDRV